MTIIYNNDKPIGAENYSGFHGNDGFTVTEQIRFGTAIEYYYYNYYFFRTSDRHQTYFNIVK